MAASMRLSLTFILLLVAGLVVFGEARGASRGVDCSLVRCIQGGNITCDNTQTLVGACACICAPENGKNCKLHLQDGSTTNCNKNC